MKKMGIVTAVIVSLAVIGFSGCASGPERDPDAYFTVDLSGFQTRNLVAFNRQWDDFFITFPDGFPGVNFNDFSRVTIRAVAFDSYGEPLPPADSMIMVTLIYDMGGDHRGPAEGPGPNTPLKEFNVGGSMGTVHTRRGTRLTLNREPGGILFQNANVIVSYIEVQEITFHNR